MVGFMCSPFLKQLNVWTRRFLDCSAVVNGSHLDPQDDMWFAFHTLASSHNKDFRKPVVDKRQLVLAKALVLTSRSSPLVSCAVPNT